MTAAQFFASALKTSAHPLGGAARSPTSSSLLVDVPRPSRRRRQGPTAPRWRSSGVAAVAGAIASFLVPIRIYRDERRAARAREIADAEPTPGGRGAGALREPADAARRAMRLASDSVHRRDGAGRERRRSSASSRTCSARRRPSRRRSRRGTALALMRFPRPAHRRRLRARAGATFAASERRCTRLARHRDVHEHSAFRPVPRTGVIYVTTEAQKLGFSPDRSGLVQPRPGPARDRRAAGRAAARQATSRSRSTIRSTRPSPGLWELREAIASLYNALYRRGMPLAVLGRERLRLGRRARGAHARGGEPRAHQPRALPARLHGVRGAARHLQGVHRDPDPARGRARLRLQRRRPAARDPRPRPLGHPACEPVQPDRQARRGRGARALGRDGARARLHAPPRRVLLALHLPRARPARLPGRERGALRRGRRPRSGRHLRRLHEELALPGLARHLGARAEERRRGASRARARSSTAAAASRSSARRSRCSPRTTSSPRRRPSRPTFRDKRDCLLSQLERLGVRVDRAPDGTFYVWGNVASCRRRSTTAWASSAPRSRRRSSSCPASSST